MLALNEGEQGEVSSPLNGGTDHPLGHRGVAGAASTLNLTKLGGVATDQGEVLVVNLFDLSTDLGTALAVGWVAALTGGFGATRT